MESTRVSDVEVLDDLLHDVDGEGEGDNFEDAEAFFDADIDGEGPEDLSPDHILRQLDAVTTLDDDVQEEFQDSTSTPSSPQELRSDETITSPEPESDAEEKNGSIPQVLTLSPLSGDAVVQGVLDLANNEDTSLQQNTGQGEINESELPTQVETKTEDEEDTVVDEVLDAVVVSPPSHDVEAEEMPSVPPVHETTGETEAKPSASIVLPPPAPVAVVVGSMNPDEDDNDDSDESQGEEDGESAMLPPPLQLTSPDDDDEDILEIDGAVVSSLQIEEKQRMSKFAKPQSLAAKKVESDEDNTLLKALPSNKADRMDEIDLSLGDEIRVAHVTTLEPNSPFSDIHKMAGGPNADATFGISYQSMRKKTDEPHTDENVVKYSLPSGPAFPDEREFENEMELTSDLSFSVSGRNSSNPTENVDDDEFAFDVKRDGDITVLSEDDLKAGRETLEAQKKKEEENLLNELKRATDEEKKLIERTNVMESATKTEDEVVADPDALSLTELHSIYKRGLGDQEVLMDDGDEKETLKNSEASQIPEPIRSTSIMGRIFSQAQGAAETIAEGDEEDGEGETSPNTKGDVGKIAVIDDNNAEAKTEKNNVDESAEWREIKLVQHRQEDSPKFSNSPETASVSYAEAAGYYAKNPDVMQHRDVIVPEDFPSGACWKCLSRPRLTFPGAIDERDRVFCIAATAYDAQNVIVIGMLQTIYRKIMKSSRDVLLIGRHWEDVGFQGTDPSTDLRGCGVLSLLQILHLVESYPDLAHRFHALSQHATRHFPFACMLINITLQCVVSLRSGALYVECNKRSSVLSAMNRLHISLTSQLHDAFQSRSDEIPVIMKDVLNRGQTNPSKVIDEVFDGSTLRPSQPNVVIGPSQRKTSEIKQSDDNLEFTEIGLHAVDGEE
ncbi:hypothetical protein PHMEG_0001908 [Phytophthora megakarya]|uniref:ELMO domain-containing protein n=1 Tax=Phytophthora megakarya TaxID=4795 RepID=A0A225WZI0_9STRA|nr:hypothetical protein PHMEG_0001908 [Phytophthora megakarya]